MPPSAKVRLATKTRFVLPLFLLGVAAHGAMARAQSAGSFTATGSMITPRFRHTATLLPGGKVLIAGGVTFCSLGDPPCISAGNAELYDPVTGTFAAIGNMTIAYPTGGVLLPDGRVLFAGDDVTHTQAIVELYDPSTGRFNVAGKPATLTGVYSVTRLNDGRVLLHGRVRISPPLAFGAEVYDPATGSFSPVANWPAEIGYAYGPAVAADGRVLFENGLYDPATGTFRLTNLFPYMNSSAPATLLLNGKILVAGGNTDGGNLSFAQLYDSTTATIASTGSMSSVRNGHTADLLPDGTVLAAGGLTAYNFATQSISATASAELYDPATGGFSLAGSMTTPRSSHAAVVLTNGQLLITGGELSIPSYGPFRSFSGISSAELYTPAVLTSAPVLFSLSEDGQGQGAIWHATTGQIASPGNAVSEGEILSLYTTNLASGGVIRPEVAIGGRLAEILYFGDAPGFPGYYQVNFRMPPGVAPGPAVSVRLTYLGRPSNEVTMGAR
jgi:hypothetical protein